MPMNMSPGEQKRAKNIIWTVAEDYSVEPAFVSADEKSRADFYLNLIVGLAYKWINREKLSTLFLLSEGTAFRELYDGVLWIALEQCLYEKELPYRPVLQELRLAYAKRLVGLDAWFAERNRITMLQVAKAQKILGQKPFLMPKDARLLEALEFSGSLTDDQIIDRFKGIIATYFKISLTSEKKYKKTKKRCRLFFRKKIKISQIGRTEDVEDVSGNNTKNQLGIFSHSDRANKKNYEELRKKFGDEIEERQRIKEKESHACTGIHKENRLFFAGAQIDSPRYIKNKNFYTKNKQVYDSLSCKLQEKLKTALAHRYSEEHVCTVSGHLISKKAWKLPVLENTLVFRRKTEQYAPSFSVDILLDASASQMGREQEVATQAYIVEKALSGCSVPCQLWSFHSFKNYTVIHCYKKYHEKTNLENIFSYQAGGWNRDGLALRVIGQEMENSAQEQKLLLMFTDASPNDEWGISAFAQYTGKAAVEDVQAEIHSIEKKGIKVIAVFMGSDRNTETAKTIYGDSFVRITHIEQLAEALGAVIQKRLHVV